jgi:glyoxylase-like metal-dependent hydrolase (beta-lactamase superfamily II)
MEAPMPTIEVRARAVGPWPMNAYALVDVASGDSALVDPGADPAALLDLLAGTTPQAILLTHSHPDHVGALGELRARLGVPLYAHPGPHFQGLPLTADHELRDGDRLAIGALRLRAYAAPGHIDDMICFEAEGADAIIVGDTIFAGGPGRTWSAEAFQTTLHTLREVVLQWPDAAICYPGHGPSFRLGDLRPKIAAFIARPHPAGFFGDAVW